MIKVLLKGIHDFQKVHNFCRCDRLENYDTYQCTKCKLTGRQLNLRTPFILVSDTYSKERIEKCVQDEFVDKYIGKQIQLICKIKAFKDFPDLSIYSVHTIVKPPKEKNQVNGERGVWVKSNKKLVKILFDEYVEYPIKPINRKRKRTIIVKRKRTKNIKLKRTRTKN